MSSSLEVIVGCVSSGKTQLAIDKLIEHSHIHGHEKCLYIDSNQNTHLQTYADFRKFTTVMIDIVKVDYLAEVFVKRPGFNYSVVAIDNIHFYEDLEYVIKRMIAKGMHIICAGLDSDWKGLGFDQVSKLLPISTTFNKLIGPACSSCIVENYKNSAHVIQHCSRTAKIVNSYVDKDSFKNSLYSPVCLHHHEILKNDSKYLVFDANDCYVEEI
jgi:thymidine kinase